MTSEKRLRWQSVAVVLLSTIHATVVRAQDSDPGTTEGFGEPDLDDVGDDASEPSSDAVAAQCSPECREGFECVDGQCVSRCNPACGEGRVCTAERRCEASEPAEEPEDVVAEKNLETERIEREERLLGIRGFGGVQFGGGVTLYSPRIGDRIQSPNVEGAFMFALKGGVFIRQVELSLEVAPGSYLPVTNGGGNQTSFLANVGYHGHVSDNFYWPVRIGAGLVTWQGDVQFQGRLDVLSLSMKTKYVLADFTFPSFRYTSDFDSFHMWTGMFNVAVSYISP